MKKALITGITGQDGSYLAQHLLNLGYEVHGIKRRASSFNTQRLDHLYQDPHETDRRLFLHYGDLSDSSNLTRILADVRPDEIYNLAAMSHVKVSFDLPEYTGNVDGLGALRLLESLRQLNLLNTKVYQASTSELYGKVHEVPQTESTPFYPRSPYGVAKLYAYWITKNYREAYNLFACNGILFNHESPVRGETFVTRKITRAVARIQFGFQDCLYLGNLDARRDWGHARDYVKVMHLILQHDTPDDWVIATGETHTVRAFAKAAFASAGITIEFSGKEEQEIATVTACENFPKLIGTQVIAVDPKYYRPTEVDLLVGDASKALRELGWKAETSFQELVSDMVAADIEWTQRELHLKQAGYKTYSYFE